MSGTIAAKAYPLAANRLFGQRMLMAGARGYPGVDSSLQMIELAGQKLAAFAEAISGGLGTRSMAT